MSQVNEPGKLLPSNLSHETHPNSHLRINDNAPFLVRNIQHELFEERIVEEDLAECRFGRVDHRQTDL